MGRPRTFDEHEVLTAATELFTRLGYAATSIDDLVSATGVHRGSLYKAFGSKQGMFVATLRRAHLGLVGAPAGEQDPVPATTALDLLLVAALELAPRDATVRDLLDSACHALGERAETPHPSSAATLLGCRLLERAHTPEPAP